MKMKQWVVVGLVGACLSGPCLAWAAGGGENKSAQTAASQADVQGQGVLKGINAHKRTVNVQHDAIAALGWPAMTMDFPIGPGVKLDGLKPGQKIHFLLLVGTDKSYQIKTITPVP